MPNTVSTIVYKYNPNGFLLIGAYIICLATAIWNVRGMSMGEILFFGALFLAIPLYVQYGNSDTVRMLVPDERPLIFSKEGVDFGDDHYSIKGLETAAIFLESFTGFEYRLYEHSSSERTLNPYNKSNGDANKISIRFEGEVVDFTFCLMNYAQFCMFKAVVNEWIAAGVNVVLRQAFDDEFIRTEMEFYQTPIGLV